MIAKPYSFKPTEEARDAARALLQHAFAAAPEPEPHAPDTARQSMALIIALGLCQAELGAATRLQNKAVYDMLVSAVVTLAIDLSPGDAALLFTRFTLDLFEGHARATARSKG